jgi:hypothetical protein
MDSQLESILFDGNWKTCAEGNEIGLQRVVDDALAKNSVVSNADWNEPLTKTTAKERFQKAVELVFANPEAQQEALRIGREALAAARAAIVAAV